jgi:hypothetical protein
VNKAIRLSYDVFRDISIVITIKKRKYYEWSRHGNTFGYTDERFF